MNILAVETSCDETSVAIVREGRHILANVIASQIALHQKYGGVVPELASRQHVVTIIPVLEEAFLRAGIGWKDIDAVAVTRGPGLSPALLVGVNAAKALAFAQRKALLGVNHMEGHIYSNWLIPEGAQEAQREPQFPALCLIVSGGHSELVIMTGHGQYQLLGKTVDDAAGEAFDKAARILGLGYPGGPAIQKSATEGNPTKFPLPRASLKGTYDFSFSGLKTALLRKVQEYGVTASKPAPWQREVQPPQHSTPISPGTVQQEQRHNPPGRVTTTLLPGNETTDLSSFSMEIEPIIEPRSRRSQTPPPTVDDTQVNMEGVMDRKLPVSDLAASFQAALVDMLVDKTVAAAAEFRVKEVLVAGGVAANAHLREELGKRLVVPFRYPPLVLCTDNAAMIAAAGFYRYAESVQHDLTMDIEPNARYV